jgi:hypothetical protein
MTLLHSAEAGVARFGEKKPARLRAASSSATVFCYPVAADYTTGFFLIFELYP